MRIGVLSDIHSGIGANNPALRSHYMRAMSASVQALNDEQLDLLYLNGDTTDHLGNRLSSGTHKEFSLEVLAPLRRFIREHRHEMQTVALAGNTDWVLADPNQETRNLFYDYTGLEPWDVSVPIGGLLDDREVDDVIIIASHGHAFDQQQLPKGTSLQSVSDYTRLYHQLLSPNEEFLDAISATTGAHRNKYLLACGIGAVVKRLPKNVRDHAVSTLGGKNSQSYERIYAKLLRNAHLHHRKVVGIMGHSHIAGSAIHDHIRVVNTGTSGAKLNPLQRAEDGKAHVAVIDTTMHTIEMIESFNGRAHGGTSHARTKTALFPTQ